MKRAIILLVAGTIVSGIAAYAASAQPRAQPVTALTLQAFECGKLVQKDLGWFSDTFRFQGEKRELIAGCYLIRHPKGTLLWDTGLPSALVGAKNAPEGMSLDKSIVARLKEIGLSTDDITYVGISHYHADHSGGAADFPNAELLIGEGDWTALKTHKADDKDVTQLAPWINGGGKVTPVKGDKDIFGDGSVIMLDMPGHTPGHHSLLLRLPKHGAVLLTGDEYHFRENREANGVPTFNTDRADTLASHDRFEKIAANLKAKVVIQHDARDMAELPAFPAALD